MYSSWKGELLLLRIFVALVDTCSCFVHLKLFLFLHLRWTNVAVMDTFTSAVVS
jgi:hypothetical protein